MRSDQIIHLLLEQFPETGKRNQVRKFVCSDSCYGNCLPSLHVPVGIGNDEGVKNFSVKRTKVLVLWKN